MDSRVTREGSDDVSRKERRKLQNTTAQRKYRNKQREKVRELERLVSAAATQPSNASSQPWESNSNIYTGRAPQFGTQYSFTPPSGMTAPYPAVNGPFDSMTPLAFVSQSNFTKNQTIKASDTSSQSQINPEPSGYAMEPPPGDELSNEFYPLRDLYFNLSPEADDITFPSLKASQVLSYLCQDSELRTIVKNIGSEKLGLRDFVRHGLVALGSTLDERNYNSADDKPANLWIKEISSVCEPYDVQLAVWTGIQVIIQMKLQPNPGNPENPRKLPDIYTNTITMKSTPWMAASVANAELLGIPFELLLKDDSESPFTQKSTSTSIPTTQSFLGDAAFTSSQRQISVPFGAKSCTSDLAPTPVQYTHSHHPYLDLIPWPMFRSKAIIAACLNPPLIDEEDFCLDLMNNAMRCWGSLRSQHGRGEGTPWDVRSWEAAPWFIEKWAMLMDGDKGEIARNSAWWRSQRDMPSMY